MYVTQMGAKNLSAHPLARRIGGFMNAPTEEERVHTQACYAVAMHLHAKKRSTIAFQVCIGIGIAVAVYFKSIWFIGGALIVSIAIHVLLIQSCIRFVNRSIGMPWDVQAVFRDRYRTDQEFARDVNKLMR